MLNGEIVLICVYSNAFFDIQIFTRSITLNRDEGSSTKADAINCSALDDGKTLKTKQKNRHTNIYIQKNWVKLMFTEDIC